MISYPSTDFNGFFRFFLFLGLSNIGVISMPNLILQYSYPLYELVLLFYSRFLLQNEKQF